MLEGEYGQGHVNGGECYAIACPVVLADSRVDRPDFPWISADIKDLMQEYKRPVRSGILRGLSKTSGLLKEKPSRGRKERGKT
jgi:hypothetical protein